MERFDQQHLDGLTLEAQSAAIRIDYSEPDQGGTRLLRRFRFYADGRVERENGYAGDRKLQATDITRDKVPDRVIADGLSWLRKQREVATGKPELIETLNRIESALR